MIHQQRMSDRVSCVRSNDLWDGRETISVESRTIMTTSSLERNNWHVPRQRVVLFFFFWHCFYWDTRVKRRVHEKDHDRSRPNLNSWQSFLITCFIVTDVMNEVRIDVIPQLRWSCTRRALGALVYIWEHTKRTEDGRDSVPFPCSATGKRKMISQVGQRIQDCWVSQW